MKEIFDWLREQINEGREFEHDERNECFNNALDYAIRRVDEAEAKWEVTKAEIRNKAITEFAEEAMTRLSVYQLQTGYPTEEYRIILRDLAE